MTEEHREILFEKDKKITVGRMLDNAVKNYGLPQADYLRLKEELLRTIEAVGNEEHGLIEFMNLTTSEVKKVLDVQNIDLSQDEALPDVNQYQAAVIECVEDAKEHNKPKEDKARLLKLLELLPPYLPQEKLEHYQNLIRRLPTGEPTEAAQMKTVGDAECEIIDIVKESFTKKLADLIKQAPTAFVDEIVSDKGKKQVVKIGPSLQKQLQQVYTVRQFLSLKDIIVRHVSAYKKRQATKKAKKSRFKFW